MKLRVLAEIFRSYSGLEKTAFVFNTLQSVLSELVLAGLNAYIFQSIFTHTGDESLALVFVAMAATYFVVFVPLWGYWMERGQARFKKRCADLFMKAWLGARPDKLEANACARFLDVGQIDVEKAAQFGGWPCVVLFQAIFSGVAAIVSFWLISWKILLVLVALGCVPLLFDTVLAKENRRVLEASRDKVDEKGRSLLNVLNNQTMFRVFGQLETRKDMFLAAQNEASMLEKKTAEQNAKADFLHDLVYDGLYRFVILVGGFLLASAGEITVGSVAFMLSMSEGLAFFLSDIGAYWRNAQALRVSVGRLETMYNTELSSQRPARTSDKPMDGLVVENVTFGYGKKSPLLTKASARFDGKKNYLITGENGAGKSTLLKLLYGYYTPQNGMIACCPESASPSLSRKIGYVCQQPEIFSGTWMAALNAPNEKELEAVLQITRLVPVWRSHPVILENGKNFSLGERTRLAIARALLQKPDVLLFDEADAHIDAQTFLEILRDIPGYLPSVSIIAVSHIQDGRAYEGFEQVVIQNGQIKRI